MNFVPTLDLRRFDADRSVFLSEVSDAYRSLGFCVFSHHGLDEELIENSYHAFRMFFDLPLPTKMKYWSEATSGRRGYTPFKVETAKTSDYPDLKEFWHIGRLGVSANHPFASILLPNTWPPEAPALGRYCAQLYMEMEALGGRILDILGQAIGLAPGFFSEITRHGNSVLRGLHYPPVFSADAPCVRAHAHEDISLITLLLGAQGGGLEILSPQGQWLPVSAQGNQVVVNVGDMMQRLTNHVYVSTTHRVVNPEGEGAKKSRYSIPFFMDPNPDYLIKTLPSCITPDNPDRYPTPITANDYLNQRLAEIKVSK